MNKAGYIRYFLILLLSAGAFFMFEDSPLSELAAQGKNNSIDPPVISPAEINGLSSPTRISFGPAQTLLVTDAARKIVVYVYPETNAIAGGFPVDGVPLGIAYGKRNIFVGNDSKDCISVFSENGTWLEDITGDALAPITKPTDLEFDPSTNQLYVLDFAAKAIKIFGPKGQERGSIPTTFPNPDLLATPTAIAWDPLKMELLVSDYGGTAADGTAIKPRIQIFDAAGNLTGSISSYTSGGMLGGKYIFSRPQGLQVDSSGKIFLTDCYSGEVLILDRNSGAVLKTLGGYGTEPGKMRLPLDLVLDDLSKDVFVTNNLLKRIEIFRQGGIY